MQWWEHARLARRRHARWWHGGLHAWVAGMLVVLLLLLLLLMVMVLLRMLLLLLVLLRGLGMLLLLLLGVLAIWIHVRT